MSLSSLGTDLALRRRNHPAIDFVNSVRVVKGKTIDLLVDGLTMRRWLVTSGVSTLCDLSSLTAAQSNNLADALRGLREEFRNFLTVRISSNDLSHQDVTFINQRLAHTKSVQVLVAGDDRWQLETRPDPASKAVLTSEFAAVCADFIANVSPSKVRKCANPSCNSWFTDSHRGAPRRWCAMATCGHLAKYGAANQRNHVVAAGDAQANLGHSETAKV